MHPSTSSPAAAAGDTLERQKQRWPLSCTDLKVPTCWESFLEAEQAAGDQQHVGETKSLPPPQKQDGACMCMCSLALVCWLFQRFSLHRASPYVAGWGFQRLNSSHCTAQDSVTWVEDPDNHVHLQARAIFLLSPLL